MTTQTKRQVIVYPDSDGQPMADNTLQFEYIVTIQGGLDAIFKDDPTVFVAGDLLWYPVEGRPEVRMAPDVMVALGRPKGHRGSYQQWLEDDVPPQVVFEVLSPGNRFAELLRKFQFYQRYGVEEYYVYDPDRGQLSGWQRAGRSLEEISEMVGWVSPRLGIRFDMVNGELRLFDPAGVRFATYVGLARMRDAEHQRADQERLRADAEHLRADQERLRAERLEARLKALGEDPGD
jgi:Uma2 family endonuclease